MKTLKVNLFNKCTAECSHCRFNCTIDQDLKPDYDTPYNVAKQLKDNFGLDMVVVLGGEPSIYPEKTHKLLMDLHNLGLTTRIETNASWAPSLESAMDFLKPIKASNTSVMLSVDAFHSKYIPYLNNVNAIKACTTLEIPLNLEIPYLNMEKKDHPIDKETLDIEAKVKENFDYEVAIYKGNVIFIGRAADTYGDEFASGRGNLYDSCTSVPWWRESDISTTNLLYLEDGGWITKGCGIAIGNFFNQDLKEMIGNYDAEKNPIFATLLKSGPLGLAKEAEKYGYKIKADYADKCHLCHEARQVLKKIYPDILKPEYYYI